LAIVTGRVIGVDDYCEFKIGNRAKAEYCPITIKCENGDLILVSVNTKTMMEKTYIVNDETGDLIQVGMIKPKIGDWLKVEGLIYKSYNGMHSKIMKYVKKITRTVKPEKSL
jgi:hypothetical protein